MPIFNVSKIVIIESLDESEFQTGVEIEKVMRYEFSENNLPLTVERYSIKRASEFIQLIHRLADTAATYVPLLHMEMHGDRYDGLIFADNSYLSWAEVSQSLVPLNIATGFNLVCVFAACYGAYFTNAWYINHPSPCFALIGPEDEVDPGEIHRAFRTLYHHFAVEKDMGVAADLLRDLVPIKGGWFQMTMDRWFYRVMHQFVVEEASVLAVRRRAQMIIKQLNSPFIFGLAPADLEVKTYAEKPSLRNWTLPDMEVVVLLKTHEYLSRLAYERFFMTKLIPENENRFATIKDAVLRTIVPLIGK